MASIDISWLSGPDVERLALTDDEILGAVEGALAAQGRKETVIEPRVHLIPESSAKGHFNILRGYVKPLGVAGVKVVGDFVDNYERGLPSEMALLSLFDPETGMPVAVIDASAITDMRTGAMTAIGAKHLARKSSRVLGHVGARVVPYGTMSAVELSLTDIMDKVVVDDWGQCRKGLPFGALRQHVESDRLTGANLHAELGEIVAGAKPGRQSDDETILFWHRGLSITDIALGAALLAKARHQSVGQVLRYA